MDHPDQLVSNFMEHSNDPKRVKGVHISKLDKTVLPIGTDARIPPPFQIAKAAGAQVLFGCSNEAWKSIIASVIRLPKRKIILKICTAYPFLLITWWSNEGSGDSVHIIGVAPITQLRTCVIKIATIKNGHLVWYTTRN